MYTIKKSLILIFHKISASFRQCQATFPKRKSSFCRSLITYSLNQIRTSLSHKYFPLPFLVKHFIVRYSLFQKDHSNILTICELSVLLRGVRYSAFWDVEGRRLLGGHRRCETVYRSVLQDA